jgi:hypothetical protein
VKLMCALLVFAVAVAVPLADVWDVQSDNDNTAGSTDNELVHGTTQNHDLGALPGPVADQDWFLMPQQREASYEVLIDGTSGDIGFIGLTLDRLSSDGGTTLQSAQFAVQGSGGYSRALRFQNTTGGTVNQTIRVANASCATACGADDVYTIRARETTISIARFNASGSQATILLTQNTSNQAINATFYYYNSAGTLLQTGSLSNHPPRALNVFNVGTIPALTGQSGHIVVSHDGPYGGLNIKAIALEPATGFSFDTQGVTRPY